MSSALKTHSTILRGKERQYRLQVQVPAATPAAKAPQATQVKSAAYTAEVPLRRAGTMTSTTATTAMRAWMPKATSMTMIRATSTKLNGWMIARIRFESRRYGLVRSVTARQLQAFAPWRCLFGRIVMEFREEIRSLRPVSVCQEAALLDVHVAVVGCVIVCEAVLENSV